MITWLHALYFALGVSVTAAIAVHRLGAFRLRVLAHMSELREWQTIQNVRNHTEERALERDINPPILPIVQTFDQMRRFEEMNARDEEYRRALLASFNVTPPYGYRPLSDARSRAIEDMRWDLSEHRLNERVDITRPPSEQS